MHKVITTFYQAFTELDAETMVRCYHKNIRFEDPAFGELHGERAKNMWRMLCASQQGKNFQVSFDKIQCDVAKGTASWEAIYNFSQTGRKVHNKIEASFEFKDGLIVSHVDTFDLHLWSKQAFGLKGILLGKTKFFQRKLQEKTNHLLDEFERKLAHYSP